VGTPWRPWSDDARSASVVGAVVAVGVLAEWRSNGLSSPSAWVPDLAVGVSLAVAAAVVLRRDEGGRLGWLIEVAAITWFAANFAGEETRWVASTASWLIIVHRAVIGHALITHPSGRVKGWAERATIVAAYMIVLVPALGRDEWWTLWWATGLFVAYLVLVRRRTALARAAGLEALPAMAILWVTLAATATLLLVLGDAPVPEVATVAYQVGIVATIIVFAVRAAGWRRRTAEVADAVVEVTFGPGGSVRDLLADALRDPTVEVAFAVAGDGARHWVDELGRPVAPLSAAGRAVIPIRVDGAVVAELASQVDFEGLPDLLAAVESATGLAATNVRLRSRLRRQVELLEASRRRLLSTADDERVRLGERLEREAGQTMARIHDVLDGLVPLRRGPVADAVGRSRARLASVDLDLHALATGLGPAALASGGLVKALGQLAESSAIPTELCLTGPVDVVEPDSARAIYFVCAEAIANAVRHSGATRVSIRLEPGDDRWALLIVDDGCGGADTSAGSGLQGLADRVSAVGGQLRLESPVGAGTRVAVGLPLRKSDGTE
jgi:signal transduction histidine kinase